MYATFKNTRVWLGLAISAAALYFAVRGVAWDDLVAELGKAHYRWLAPGAALILLGQVTRACRWRVLFGDGPRPSLRDAFAILSVGYLVSGIFPLRLGDPVRAWLVDARTAARGPEALATVLVERAVDLLTVLVFLALLVPQPAARLLGGQLGPGPWADPANVRALTFGAVGLVYLGMAAVSILGGRAGRLAAAGLAGAGVSSAAAHRVGIAVAGFASGFGALRRPRVLLETAAWSLLIWWLGGIEYWVIMWAFDLEVPYNVAVFVLCGTAIFAILPSSPGYVGVFHTAVIVTLAIIADVPKDVALSYAIVLHGLVMVVLIGMGLVGLRMIGLSRRALGARLGGAMAEA